MIESRPGHRAIGPRLAIPTRDALEMGRPTSPGSSSHYGAHSANGRPWRPKPATKTLCSSVAATTLDVDRTATASPPTRRNAPTHRVCRPKDALGSRKAFSHKANGFPPPVGLAPDPAPFPCAAHSLRFRLRSPCSAKGLRAETSGSAGGRRKRPSSTKRSGVGRSAWSLRDPRRRRRVGGTGSPLAKTIETRAGRPEFSKRKASPITIQSQPRLPSRPLLPMRRASSRSGAG